MNEPLGRSGGPQQLTAKGQATRARIVAAAAGLMYQRGVAGTATEDVLQAAQVSNSQLYHYFTGKDDLVRAVIAYQVERVVGGQEAAWTQLDTLMALRAWADAVVAQASGNGGCPVGSLSSELAGGDEPGRVALVEGFGRWEGAIHAGLTTMRSRRILRAEADPGRLAIMTLAAMQGGLLLSHARRDSRPLRSALDGAVGYIATFAA